MKKSILFGAIILMFSLSSCKKKIYGCMDDSALNYSPVATEDLDNCIYQTDVIHEDEVLISNTLYNLSWSQGTSWWDLYITWPEISQEVLDNGAVHAYIRAGLDWTPVPFTFYQSSTYSTSVNSFYYLGEVNIEWTDSDGTLPLAPPNVDVRLIVFK